jgi:hypothetical protein
MAVALPEWLEGARLAPSAHNTQPSRFRPASRGYFRVGWDPARVLPAGDPGNRDLHLALGAAVEGAVIAAAGSGRRLRFTPGLDAGSRVVGELHELRGRPSAEQSSQAHWLGRRQTARTPHLPVPLPDELLDTLKRQADAAGCRLSVVQDRPSVRRLASLSGQAGASQFADPEVQAELWRWLRLDPGDPGYFRDGLTAECLNLHGLSLALARESLPPHRMRRLVRVRLHRLLALDAVLLVRRSAGLCLLTVPAGTPEDLVAAGRLLLRLWLAATRAGFSAHPISPLLDCPGTVGPALRVFGAEAEVPAALFRLGACPPAARSPRLPVEEMVETDAGSG